ncbi:hypothetical protein MLD38_004571 [Melastoma candidum]|uniref:Uncharacterized protein n=1 Tax=Melastoma candidum TaxID=119954 RepID=A0ACB9S5L4_9MYRT|nr:hypothetical protein MLD38_004571 [Melastoma candidum]
MAATSATPATLPLAGRVAIVTGGSRGIGRAIVIHLHSLGASVVVNYSSNSTQAEALLSELNGPMAEKPRAMAVKANISHPDEVKRLFDATEGAFASPPHIFVNCAGILDPKYPTIANTEVEDFDRTFGVNARGAFLGLREASRRVVRGGGGRIVMLTTSVVGGLFPGYGAYAASKAAVETMTRIAAKELKGTGITANCVAPGPIASEMFYAGKTEEMVKRIVDACPMGRIGDGKDVAEVVGFLVGDGGEWVNGQVVRVNGGFVI